MAISKPDLLYKVLAGGVGGMSITIITGFLNILQFGSDLVTHDITAGFGLGIIIRVVIFGFLGSMWVFQTAREISTPVAFQLGMLPALFLLVMTSYINVASFSSSASIHSSYDSPVYRDNRLGIRWLVAEETKPITPNLPAVAPGSGVISGLTGTPPATTSGTSGLGFWIIFRVVSAFTFLSGVANVYLVVATVDATKAASLLDNFNTTWKLGFGAIIGLIGGKTF